MNVFILDFKRVGSLGIFERKLQMHLDICVTMVLWYERQMRGCLLGKINGRYGEIKGVQIFDI